MAEDGAEAAGGAVLKAVIYLTRTDPATNAPQLVVFDHVDAPEAGTQVPAGTVEDGEDVAAAALREAFEETGLTGIRLVAPLGVEDVDLRPYGVEAIARRHFFHATIDVDPVVDAGAHADVDADVEVDVDVEVHNDVDGGPDVARTVPERWHHVESDRSDGGPPITLALRWTPLASPPALSAELGARLWMVQAALIADVAAVIEAERVWVEAHRRMDVGAIAQLMADDYSSLRDDGAVWGRAETLARYVPGRRHWDEADSDGYHVRLSTDAALLVARWRARGVNSGAAFDYRARFTAVYVRRGGRWLLLHDHSTAMG